MVKPAVYTIGQQKAKEKAIEAGVVTEIPKKPDAAADDLEVGVTNGRCSRRARNLTAVIILALLIIGTVTVIALFAVHQTQKSHEHQGHHGERPDCSSEEDRHPIDQGGLYPPEEHHDPEHDPNHNIGGNDGHDDHQHPDDDDDDDHPHGDGHHGGDHDHGHDGDDDRPGHDHDGDHHGDGDRPGDHHDSHGEGDHEHDDGRPEHDN